MCAQRGKTGRGTQRGECTLGWHALEMGIEFRTPTDDDWLAICHFDGRTFGATYSPEEIEQRRPLHDMSRFRMAVDGGKIVGVAGSYALEATLPGSQVIPMGGVTWVAVAATHQAPGRHASVGGRRTRRHRGARRAARDLVCVGGWHLRPRGLRGGYAGTGHVDRHEVDADAQPRLPRTRLGPLSRRRRDRPDAGGDLEPIPVETSGRSRAVDRRRRVPGGLGGDPERRVHRRRVPRPSRRVRRVPHEDGLERRPPVPSGEP